MGFMNTIFSIQNRSQDDFLEKKSESTYHIFLFEGTGKLMIDFMEYKLNGKYAIFTSPFQHYSFQECKLMKIIQVDFHGDFYCIEYHKKEVACNGILFNNIYQTPFVQLYPDEYDDLLNILKDTQKELQKKSELSESVIKAYLQLFLAKSSQLKQEKQTIEIPNEQWEEPMEKFKQLIEENFRELRSPSQYATLLAITPNNLSKKSKQYFGKTPSQLIQDRIVLEAKKLLHLTHKPVKEIAFELNFEDEYYFSRYFKKSVGLSPQNYRDEGGISIVADLSIQKK